MASNASRYHLLSVFLLVTLELAIGVPPCKGPEKVTNLMTERLSSSKVRLTWTAATSAQSKCALSYELSHCSTTSYWQNECNLTSISLPINTTEITLSVEPCKYNHVSVTTIGQESNSSAEVLIISPRIEYPEPPAKMSVEVITSTTFSLTWEDSDNSASECRMGYRICFSPVDTDRELDYNCVFEERRVAYPDYDNKWTNSHLPTAACTNYTASVAAVYDSLDLDGKASDTISVTFHTPPENVQSLSVSATSQTSIGLKWSESQSVSECAHHYTISWCDVSYPWDDHCVAEAKNLTTEETTFDITGLTTCSYYWITVATYDEDGLASQTKELIITPAVADEVSNLEVVYVSGSQFTASWEVAGGGGCISSTIVCWQDAGIDNGECDHTNRDFYESRFDLTLQTCSNYTVNVTSLDTQNATSNTITAHFSTGPDNAIGLNATDVATHSAFVTWEPSPSSCVHHYVLGSCPTDYPDEPCSPTGIIYTNNTDYNVTGLEACTYSVISIRAVTADGQSSASSQTIVKTKLDEFGPSTHVVLTAFNARLFSWEYRVPSNAAHCTTGYTGCFKEEGSSDEPICLHTSNLQYWSNYDNATKACTKYDAQLIAFSDDNRTWNTSTSFISPPDEVINLQVRNGTAGPDGVSVVITWQVSPDNGCMTHQHLNCSRVQLESGNDHAMAVLSSTGANLTNDVTEYEIGNLEPCAQYTVNVFQEPTPLDPIPTEVLFRTASNVTSVTFLKVVSTEAYSVNVSYQASEASPSCVSKYSVCWRQVDNGTDTCQTERGSGVTEVSIEGLETCTQYTVSVTPVAPNSDKYDTVTVTAETTGCAGTTTNTMVPPNNTTGGSFVLKASLTIHTGLLLWVLLLL